MSLQVGSKVRVIKTLHVGSEGIIIEGKEDSLYGPLYSERWKFDWLVKVDRHSPIAFHTNELEEIT
jgi:hypothetical protein